MGNKVTNAEKTKRINTIHDMLVLGVRRPDILQYASEKTNWELTDRQIDTYIAQATALIEAAGVLDREKEIAQMKERFEMLWGKNMQIQDYKAALAVLKERASLLGLSAPTEVKHSGTVEFVVVEDEQSTEV